MTGRAFNPLRRKLIVNFFEDQAVPRDEKEVPQPHAAGLLSEPNHVGDKKWCRHATGRLPNRFFGGPRRDGTPKPDRSDRIRQTAEAGIPNPRFVAGFFVWLNEDGVDPSSPGSFNIAPEIIPNMRQLARLDPHFSADFSEKPRVLGTAFGMGNKQPSPRSPQSVSLQQFLEKFRRQIHVAGINNAGF